MATEGDDDRSGLMQAVAHHGLASASPIGRVRISGFRGIVYRWPYRRYGGDRGPATGWQRGDGLSYGLYAGGAGEVEKKERRRSKSDGKRDRGKEEQEWPLSEDWTKIEEGTVSRLRVA
jgi:hypothetical protein